MSPASSRRTAAVQTLKKTGTTQADIAALNKHWSDVPGGAAEEAEEQHKASFVSRPTVRRRGKPE